MYEETKLDAMEAKKLNIYTTSAQRRVTQRLKNGCPSQAPTRQKSCNCPRYKHLKITLWVYLPILK